MGYGCYGFNWSSERYLDSGVRGVDNRFLLVELSFFFSYNYGLNVNAGLAHTLLNIIANAFLMIM